MPPEKAVWYPVWYELDQSLEVGRVDSFGFFRKAPDHISAGGRPVFYFGDWNDKQQYYFAKKRVLSIHHHQLGSIHKIDARGLDYTLTLSDGRVLKVEAEETPGLVYGRHDRIEDWHVHVEPDPA